MQKIGLKRTATALVLAAVALFLGALSNSNPVQGKEKKKTCSLENVKGAYGSVITATGSVNGSLVVSTTIFKIVIEETGNITGSGFQSVNVIANGAAFPVSIAGTGTVNEDCTTTSSFLVTNPQGTTGPVELKGLFVDGGKEIRLLQTTKTPTDLPLVVTINARKVD